MGKNLNNYLPKDIIIYIISPYLLNQQKYNEIIFEINEIIRRHNVEIKDHYPQDDDELDNFIYFYFNYWISDYSLLQDELNYHYTKI